MGKRGIALIGILVIAIVVVGALTVATGVYYVALRTNDNGAMCLAVLGSLDLAENDYGCYVSGLGVTSFAVAVDKGISEFDIVLKGDSEDKIAVQEGETYSRVRMLEGGFGDALEISKEKVNVYVVDGIFDQVEVYPVAGDSECGVSDVLALDECSSGVATSLGLTGGVVKDDSDDDGVYDDYDNCVDDVNPGQEDKDSDGIGDACDPVDDGKKSSGGGGGGGGGTSGGGDDTKYPPVAYFDIEDSDGVYHVDEVLIFNATQSNDPDGSIVEYIWDFENDGIVDVNGSSEIVVSHAYSFEGSYNANLSVRDDEGYYGSVVSQIIVESVGGACTNGDTQLCGLQDGVCAGSFETCSDGVWPGCDYSSIGGYEISEQTCGDGSDNDCDGGTDCSDSDCFYDPACSSGECGNRIIDAGEECDDGNFLPGDGCDGFCLIEDSVLLWYNFNDDISDGVTDDLTNNARDGTCDISGSDCPVYLSGQGPDGSGTYSFDGIDDGIFIPSYTPISSQTMIAWMKVGAYNGSNILFWSADGTGQRVWSGFWRIYRKNASGQNMPDPTIKPTPSLGSWVHVAFVYDINGDSVNISYYYNGEYQRSIEESEGFTPEVMDVIGRATSAGETHSLEGYLDEVMVFNRALSGDEVLRVFDAVGGECGDGSIRGIEICDGNSEVCEVGDGYLGIHDCLSTCDGWGDCIPTEWCGDGILNGYEQCDDGNNNDGDGCSGTCVEEISGVGLCDNGLDDDGDGLVDWQFDLGCSGPDDTTEVAQDRDLEDGWTTFDLAGDANVIYVSSSDGDDAYYDGECDVPEPITTVYDTVLDNVTTEGYRYGRAVVHRSDGSVYGYLSPLPPFSWFNVWGHDVHERVYDSDLYQNWVADVVPDPLPYDYRGFNLEPDERTLTGFTIEVPESSIVLEQDAYIVFSDPVLINNTVIENSEIHNSIVVGSKVVNANISGSRISGSEVMSVDLDNGDFSDKYYYGDVNTYCGPKATPIAGYGKLRDGYPDWLLFKRGDSWEGQAINDVSSNNQLGSPNKGGRSADFPLVIATYGDSLERPVFSDISETFFGPTGGPLDFVALKGLEVYSSRRDPNSLDYDGSGGSFVGRTGVGGDWFLIEDCYANYAGIGISGGTYVEDGTFGLQVRRNIVSNSHSTTKGHAQGMFLSNNFNVLIEDNLFDHNGWDEDYDMISRIGHKDASEWEAISDGRFRLWVNGTYYNFGGVDFSGVGSMDDVATRLQNLVNSVLPGGSIEVLFRNGVFLTIGDFGTPPRFIDVNHLSRVRIAEMSMSTSEGDGVISDINVTPDSSDVADWKGSSKAGFGIKIAGAGTYYFDSFRAGDDVDFTQVSTMDDVASVFEDGVNVAVLEDKGISNAVSVVWDGQAFLFLALNDSLTVSNFLDPNGESGAKVAWYNDDVATELQVQEWINEQDTWNPDATQFNHNMYLASENRNLTVRNNIISRGSASGLQARPGGILENNFFIRNAGSHVGRTSGTPVPGGVNGTWKDNVVLEATYTSGTDSRGGNGLESNHIGHFVVEGNIVANSNKDAAGGSGLSVGGAHEGIKDLVIRNNIVYNSTASALSTCCYLDDYNSSSTTVQVYDNLFQSFKEDTNNRFLIGMKHRPDDPWVSNDYLPYFDFHDNTYYCDGCDPDAWFSLGIHDGDPNYDGIYVGLDGWVNRSGEIGAEARQADFIDPNRNLQRYNNEVLGGVADFDAFMDDAKSQRNQYNWHEEYTADAVNNYIREGFTEVGLSPAVGEGGLFAWLKEILGNFFLGGGGELNGRDGGEGDGGDLSSDVKISGKVIGEQDSDVGLNEGDLGQVGDFELGDVEDSEFDGPSDVESFVESESGDLSVEGVEEEDCCVEENGVEEFDKGVDDKPLDVAEDEEDELGVNDNIVENTSIGDSIEEEKTSTGALGITGRVVGGHMDDFRYLARLVLGAMISALVFAIVLYSCKTYRKRGVRSGSLRHELR